MKRVLTAAIAVPILVYVLWYAPPYVFNVLVIIAAVLGIREFQIIADRVGYQGPKWVGWVGGVMVLISFWQGKPEGAVLILAAVMAAAMITHRLWRHSVETSLMSTSATVAGVVYVAVFLGYLVSLRMIEGGTTALSAKLLSFFLLVNWAADTIAMLVGRTMGKRLLLPVISPKKTVEGGLGGLVGSMAGAVLAHFWFFSELRLTDALVLGAIMGTVGQVGDWCESMLKRGSGIKDTANIIPGHGGILDRLDSLLFNAPILYYYYRIFMAS
ncbi:MAG: phosphatidate cytidylyltransferase [Acidobacteria bacterium]|nr:phosphatidate cytidylyltransferase [Acidobacteriota bacterium]